MAVSNIPETTSLEQDDLEAAATHEQSSQKRHDPLKHALDVEPVIPATVNGSIRWM